MKNALYVMFFALAMTVVPAKAMEGEAHLEPMADLKRASENADMVAKQMQQKADTAFKEHIKAITDQRIKTENDISVSREKAREIQKAANLAKEQARAAKAKLPKTTLNKVTDWASGVADAVTNFVSKGAAAIKDAAQGVTKKKEEPAAPVKKGEAGQKASARAEPAKGDTASQKNAPSMPLMPKKAPPAKPDTGNVPAAPPVSDAPPVSKDAGSSQSASPVKKTWGSAAKKTEAPSTAQKPSAGMQAELQKKLAEIKAKAAGKSAEPAVKQEVKKEPAAANKGAEVKAQELEKENAAKAKAKADELAKAQEAKVKKEAEDKAAEEDKVKKEKEAEAEKAKLAAVVETPAEEATSGGIPDAPPAPDVKPASWKEAGASTATVSTGHTVKADESKAGSAAKPAGKADLLKQIQEGKALKKVKVEKAPATGQSGMMETLQKKLSGIKHAVDPEADPGAGGPKEVKHIPLTQKFKPPVKK